MRENEAIILNEAENIIRRSLLDMPGMKNNITVNQESTVPLNHMTRILYGSENYSQAALTISQLIKYNFAKRFRHGQYQRHSMSQETPLNIYTGYS